jgi:hypothetical protein
MAIIPNITERASIIMEFDKTIVKLTDKWDKYCRFKEVVSSDLLMNSFERETKIKILDNLLKKSELELHEAIKLTGHYRVFVKFLDVAEEKGLTDEAIQNIINSAPSWHDDDLIWWKRKLTYEASYFKMQTAQLLGITEPADLTELIPFSTGSDEDLEYRQEVL